MTTMQETTTYDVEGRLLEVCNCEAICPCWVGLDPDNGTCDSILAWAVDRGTVKGVDVSDRVIGLSVHIPGNVLAGNWKAVVYVDERCDEAQQEALLVGLHRPARRRGRGPRRPDQRRGRRRAGADHLRRRRRPRHA